MPLSGIGQRRRPRPGPPARAGGPSRQARLEARCARRPGCPGGRSRRARRCSGRWLPGNGLNERTPSASATSTSPGSTSRTYSASMRSRAQVSEATTRGAVHAAEHERPEAPGVARGDEGFRGQEEQGERPHHLVEARHDRVLDALAVAGGVEVEDDLGVGGGLEDRARRLELAAQDGGVHQVAVVADRDRAAVALDEVGLRVRGHGVARGRVADVADRAVPGQRLQAARREHVVHEAHALARAGASCRRRRRCPPTPARGAAGRRARCRRGARPRGGRRCRRGRTGRGSGRPRGRGVEEAAARTPPAGSSGEC